MKIFMAATILTALVTPVAAQWVNRRTPGIPRTADGKPRPPDGKPDLTGLWDMITDSAVGNISVRNAGDLKPADVQPWARALLQERAEDFGKDNPRYRCLPEGRGSSTGTGMKGFLQTPAMIAILSEDLSFRQIF